MARSYKALSAGQSVRLAAGDQPQKFDIHDRHRWYNFVLGFSDKLVASMMDILQIGPGALVLDPFCGTGTTLVESMKRGVDSVGIDASPFSCFVSRVKTDRSLEADGLMSAFLDAILEYRQTDRQRFIRTQTYRYLADSGMLHRGWIGEAALLDTLAMKAAIQRSAPTAAYRNALMLALTANLSTKIGNMKYGPEIYCGPPKRRVGVVKIFQRNVTQMLQDLRAENLNDLGSSTVIRGDARQVASLLKRRGVERVHAVISSPPYPAEHDYTRNTRLELALLDFVSSAECVQSIKRSMIRSHTKGIYRSDNDSEFVSASASVEALAALVEKNSRDKKHGFARLYPTVVREYFGGMKRHLEGVANMLVPRGRYAIVVGDQASYLGTHIRTADLLGELAEQSGFVVENLFVWRTRTSTTGGRPIKEHALILRRKAG